MKMMMLQKLRKLLMSLKNSLRIVYLEVNMRNFIRAAFIGAVSLAIVAIPAIAQAGSSWT
jgi:hypothetical protein